MNSGIGAISAAVSRRRRLRSTRPFGNATPWSAATTISESSHMPSSFSFFHSFCSWRSANIVCSAWRWNSTSSWPWSSKDWVDMPSIASFGWRR